MALGLQRADSCQRCAAAKVPSNSQEQHTCAATGSQRRPSLPLFCPGRACRAYQRATQATTTDAAIWCSITGTFLPRNKEGPSERQPSCSAATHRVPCWQAVHCLAGAAQDRALARFPALDDGTLQPASRRASFLRMPAARCALMLQDSAHFSCSPTRPCAGLAWPGLISSHERGCQRSIQTGRRPL